MEGSLMKKRQMLLGCLLALVLSVSAVLSACSSGDNSPAGNKKSAGQIVGVWEAYDVFEPGLGNLKEGAAYDDYKEQFHAIYAFSFAEDGTGLFTRFGIMKPFTWTVDADGKITVTLEGTAGSFTGQIDAETGRLRLKGTGDDETDAELKQISTTAGDYASATYQPFDQLTNKGTLPTMVRYNDLKIKNFEITREVNKVLIDTDKLYMNLYAIAQVPGSSQEGYVFEIVNKYSYNLFIEFSLGDLHGPLKAFNVVSLQPGERFYMFTPNISDTPGSLVALSNPKAMIAFGYTDPTTGTVIQERQRVELDLNIPPKSE
jgi:putative lipoprotein